MRPVKAVVTVHGITEEQIEKWRTTAKETLDEWMKNPLLIPIVHARPGVGVATIIYNRYNKMLLGKRRGLHGGGTWSVPGGHLEFGENPKDAAVREILEETGIVINPLTLERLTFSSAHHKDEGKHNISLFFFVRDAELDDTPPPVKEPEKCEEWGWFHPEHLPDPLFLGLASFIDSNGLP